jgi:hypothetical protein
MHPLRRKSSRRTQLALLGRRLHRMEQRCGALGMRPCIHIHTWQEGIAGLVGCFPHSVWAIPYEGRDTLDIYAGMRRFMSFCQGSSRSSGIIFRDYDSGQSKHRSYDTDVTAYVYTSLLISRDKTWNWSRAEGWRTVHLRKDLRFEVGMLELPMDR